MHRRNAEEATESSIHAVYEGISEVQASRGQKCNARMGPDLPSNNQPTKLFHPHFPVSIFDNLDKTIRLTVLVDWVDRRFAVSSNISHVERHSLCDHGLC